MRNTIRFLGFIALAAIMGFTMAGCNNDPGGGGDPALTGTVSIDGTAEVGQTLTALTTALVGEGTISYQWKRNPATGSAVNIGTNNTYLIAEADIGFTITVTVTRAGYSGDKTSEPTATVTDPDAPPLTGSVSIGGFVQVGQTLTALTTLLGGEGTINYQWKRTTGGGTPVIIGTNSSTYQVQSADIGSTITVTVTRTGNSNSVSSLATAVVPNPNETGTINISVSAGGDASVNATLTDGVLILSRSGTATVTLANSGQYDPLSIRWKVENTARTGSGASFILDASDYQSGKLYFLTVQASRDDIPYDHTISFKVEE